MRRARTGVLCAFCVNGVVIATWMSRLPDVKQHLGLTPGGLSVLLLALSAGAVAGLPTAGRVVARLGATTTVRLGACVALPGAVVAAAAVAARAPVGVAMGGLFLLGLGSGIWDVAQNVEGTVVEQAMQRSVMPWFHAAFSAGTVAAALFGAAMTYLQVPLPAHVGAVAAGALAVVWWATAATVPTVSPTTVETGDGAADQAVAGHEQRPAGARAVRQRSAWTEPRTLLIGLVVLAAAFTEGTANDWLAVAFVDGHGLSNAAGVLATAVFLASMTAGRVLGTGLLDRYGRVAVLRVQFAAALLGCALVVLAGPGLAFLGAAVWGVGASLGFPVGMSAAADDPARAAQRISVVATIGYLAFLAGPPLLGLLGDHLGILDALLAVGAVSLLAILLAPATAPPPINGSSGRALVAEPRHPTP